MDIFLIMIIVCGVITISMLILYFIVSRKEVDDVGDELTNSDDSEVHENFDGEMENKLEEQSDVKKISIDENNEKHFDGAYDNTSNDNNVKNDTYIEIITFLINNRDYVFEANNHRLRDGEYVRILYNNKFIDTIVIKANTKVLLSELETVPEKLVLETDNLENMLPVEEEKVEVNRDNVNKIDENVTKEENVSYQKDTYDDDIFTPKKKNKESD